MLMVSSACYRSVRGTIDRYKKACLDPPTSGSVAEANAQVLLETYVTIKVRMSI